MRIYLRRFWKLAGILFIPFLLALKAGDSAPEFSRKNQDGKVIQLSAYRGKFVLLYFYPKDETPGCTKEACSFRDHYSQIKAMNAVIFGVSRQGEKSHQEFKSKHHLPFDLLVDQNDEGKSLAEDYNVGTIPLLGLTKRKSILIGPDGRVIRIYSEVDPTHHSDQVIKDIQAAQKATQGLGA